MKIKHVFILVFCVVPFLVSCAFFSPNIPWEDRWAASYCVTTNWEEQQIPPDSPSILCQLSEKYEVTLNEAQGIIFITALLASLPDPEATIPVIGEYVTTTKSFLADNPTITLADLILKITVDTDNPRYHLLKQLLNIAIITQWGSDPIAKLVLFPKDIYFLNAHFDNVLYQIGYNPKI